MESGKNYILGIYNDEDVLLKAVKTVRESGVKIEEVFTPYPIHGLEHALGYKRSKLPVVAFLFGLLGTTLALTMQFFMMKIDWPMIIGGKDFAPLPTFIPVTFELTVLLASFGMVGTFFVISDLKPWSRPKVFDVRSTDDKMVMAVDLSSNSTMDITRIKDILTGSGTVEVNEKSF